MLSVLDKHRYGTAVKFGFKTAHEISWPYLHSSKLWIFTLIRTQQRTCAFFDAENAFDRVNHWILTMKLLQRDTSLYIAKLNPASIIIWVEGINLWYTLGQLTVLHIPLCKWNQANIRLSLYYRQISDYLCIIGEYQIISVL